MVQIPLRKVYAHHAGIAQQRSQSVGLLFDALSASGFAMQVMHDSRPASGAEHLISHIWEMEHLSKDGLPVSHGFKVSIGTLTITYLYEQLKQLDLAGIPPAGAESWEEREQSIAAFFPDERVRKQTLAIAKEKFLDGEALLTRREKLVALLPALIERMEDQLPPYQELKDAMEKVGCPVTPEDIASDLEGLRHAVTGAQMIRNRYTVLDLYYELGLFDLALDMLSGM
jgi:glycerol-1-phosphate dehydrogenase [NAD(P)+]